MLISEVKMIKEFIFSCFTFFVSILGYGQINWTGNYTLQQDYPKRMPSEARKDSWDKLEIFKDSLGNLTWTYSNKQFASFYIMSGRIKENKFFLELFFERYDTNTNKKNSHPDLLNPYLILKNENEKYFARWAQAKEPKYFLLTKQTIIR